MLCQSPVLGPLAGAKVSLVGTPLTSSWERWNWPAPSFYLPVLLGFWLGLGRRIQWGMSWGCSFSPSVVANRPLFYLDASTQHLACARECKVNGVIKHYSKRDYSHPSTNSFYHTQRQGKSSQQHGTSPGNLLTTMCAGLKNRAMGTSVIGRCRAQKKDAWMCFVSIFFSPGLSLTFHRFPSRRSGWMMTWEKNAPLWPVPVPQESHSHAHGQAAKRLSCLPTVAGRSCCSPGWGWSDLCVSILQEDATHSGLCPVQPVTSHGLTEAS